MAEMKEKAKIAYHTLVTQTGAGRDFTGWLDWPVDYDKDELDRVKKAAARVKAIADAFIVIGIGGSYLGAKAALDFIKTPYYNQTRKDTPEIYFAGNSFSGEEIQTILHLCKDKRVAVNVISKSGSTAEPAIAFRLVMAFMASKYTKSELKDRVFVTTDSKEGALLAFAKAEGYTRFTVPGDIGGRFSALSAVGLFPLAVCGCDVDALLQGAAEERERFSAQKADYPGVGYAVLRNCFLQKGKKSEILVSYDPFLRFFGEWWKQLFGESEGKGESGIYPTTAVFTADLHSLGQYIQDGQRFLFETVLNARTGAGVPAVPQRALTGGADDGFDFIAGKPLSFVNERAFLGTALAHADGGVPVMEISFHKKDERSFGGLCFFFFAACGVSAYMLGVNPFDQPGVEAYKSNMLALLGKPGYESAGDFIKKRLKTYKGLEKYKI